VVSSTFKDTQAMSAIFKPIKPAPAPTTEFVDADDHINNLSANPHFDSVLRAAPCLRAW
jgi:hypothetical protein